VRERVKEKEGEEEGEEKEREWVKQIIFLHISKLIKISKNRQINHFLMGRN
jgi:hypothetical protein